MKESKLIEMSNKIDALTRIVQRLINELNNVKDLSVGTLETIKKMPKYKEAIEKLKKELKKAAELKKENKLELEPEK
jgi:cell shape-determining protein MreC